MLGLLLSGSAGWCAAGEAGQGGGASAPSLAVTSVRDETGSEEWRDQLIAVGLASLVEEELFASGRYRPLEARPEIREQLAELIRTSWSGLADRDAGREPEAAGWLESDVTAQAVVRKFAKSRTRASAGPFGASKVAVRVVVEVTLKDKDQPPRSAVGEGRGETNTMEAFFRSRRDRIDFDETTVGRAAHDAVREAVARLLAP